MKKTVFDKLSEGYWNLPSRIRRVVGWSILLLPIVIIVSVICYCCVPGKHEFSGKDKTTERKVTVEYNHSGQHREFNVWEKNKKRKMQYSRDFNDINEVQLAAAKRMGIRPLKNRDELEGMKSKLVEIKETKYYVIEPLTHSMPYLVPDAADFLTALGKLFQEYSETECRYVITSILRTGQDIRRLSRINVNATENSCHCYGTTIDITYNRFDGDGNKGWSQLKLDLARALYDLRQAGHCYVKYEYKQGCFHITVRPR